MHYFLVIMSDNKDHYTSLLHIICFTILDLFDVLGLQASFVPFDGSGV